MKNVSQFEARLLELYAEQQLNMKHRKYLLREILKHQNQLRRLKKLILFNNIEIEQLKLHNEELK